MTCATRLRSVCIRQEESEGSAIICAFPPASLILIWKSLCKSDSNKLISTVEYTNSKVPASIFDISRISFTNCIRRSAFILIISWYCVFSSSVFALPITSANPVIAFSGVRISWLMLARKADFAISAFSAFSFATFNSLSTCFKWVISCTVSTIFSSSLRRK